jgi:hypothetical protein
MPGQKQTTAVGVKQLGAKHVKCSIVAGRKGIPIKLFRKTIESNIGNRITVNDYSHDPLGR